MENYVLSFLGIAISVLLFLAGYRRTVGAKKERIKAANNEVEQILVRRIVLEGYTPTVADVTRLLEGKARDSQVKVGDLYSEAQVLNTIFTRIMETDFIAQAQRERFLGDIIEILEKAESAPYEEERIEKLVETKATRAASSVGAIVAMALAAVSVGASITVIADLGIVDLNLESLLDSALPTVGLSLAVILILSVMRSLLESQKEISVSSRSAAMEDAIKFERDVAKTIASAGLNPQPADSQRRGFDFSVEAGGRRLLIEVMAWKRKMPMGILARVANRLEEAADREKTSEAIVVTRNDIKIPSEDSRIGKVRFMSIRQFKDYLKSNKISA